MLESKAVMQVEQGGRKAIVTTEFSNYKEVDGITVPIHIRQLLNGQLMARSLRPGRSSTSPMADTLFTMPRSSGSGLS